MAVFSKLKVLVVSIIIASAAANGQNIALEQASDLNPLEWLGSNSPWFAGKILCQIYVAGHLIRDRSKRFWHFKRSTRRMYS
jgi:hypothetical protein